MAPSCMIHLVSNLFAVSSGTKLLCSIFKKHSLFTVCSKKGRIIPWLEMVAHTVNLGAWQTFLWITYKAQKRMFCLFTTPLGINWPHQRTKHYSTSAQNRLCVSTTPIVSLKTTVFMRYSIVSLPVSAILQQYTKNGSGMSCYNCSLCQNKT